MSKSTDKQILEKAFGLLSDYMAQEQIDNTSVVDFQTPDSIKNKIDFSISDNGISYDELFALLEKYLSLSVRTGNKQFYNQLYGGFNMPSFLGEIFTSLTNGSMYTYESSPVATIMEVELLKKMNEMAGFHHGEGTFTTGGSNANLIAMLCARNKAFPDIKSDGIKDASKMRIFVSDQAHFSIERAANALGLGTNNIVKVSSDEKGAMIPDELEKVMKESRERDEHPFFIVATAGTTFKGGFDPIAQIASIAKKWKVWLHVDGSWGGSVILSEKHKYLLEGLSEADSFAWNPHKLMNIPLICSTLLIKEKGTLNDNLSTMDSNYIFHDHEFESYDLGQMSLQCGRRVDSLKLWLAWKYFGDSGYEERINTLFEISKYAQKKVEASDKLELMAPVSFLNICFRFLPDADLDINEFNLQLRQRLLNNGMSMVNYGFLDDQLTIRLVLANPEVEKNDIDTFFENVMAVANELTKALCGVA